MVKSLFKIESTESEILLPQLEALKTRVPLLYFVLIIDTVSLSLTHHGVAPDLLTIYIPALFVGAMGTRLVHWHRLQAVVFTPKEARKAILSTIALGSALAVALLAWALSLYAHPSISNDGGLNGRTHVVFFIGMTVVNCIFLLMHVRAAALSITVVIMPAFCAYLILHGGQVETGIAINLVLVSGAMLYVLLIFSRDFETLIMSKGDLSRLNAQNEGLANTDSATGLPNRRRFFWELDEATRTRRDYTVIALDLDGFKQINDVHGHLVGDKVLVEIGRRLVAHAPPRTCVARMGGDEFALLIPRVVEPVELLALSENLIAVCRAPITLPYVVAHVGASMGLSIARAGETSFENHYERADYALFYAKKNGRGRAELFSPSHEQSIRRASRIEQAMQRADLDHELAVHYQPIVCAQTERVLAFEALARWTSAEVGAVSPQVFIPVAERSELIYRLTRIVLRKSLRDAAAWPSDIQLKINLSIRDLMSSEQMLQLIAILHETDVRPSRVSFEITESVVAEDLLVVHDAIATLRGLGCSIAIDDFGVGYSNLNYVHRLAPDTIKIDRSFIERMESEAGAMIIIKTILDLCRNLGATSVAEGIERRDQATLLRELGCDELQGFYFGKPRSQAEACALLARADQAETLRLAVSR